MRIAILSFYSGKSNRGVETWAESLKDKIGKNFNIEIVSAVFSDFGWLKSDVIIPTNGRFQVFIARILTWLWGKPMVVFGHSGLGADDKWNLLCSPNVFVAFSSFQKEWAQKYKLPWTRVVQISHAVDTKKFHPATKEKNKTVLFVGANTPAKRVGLVKKAVELIPGVNFMAVGKGNPIEAKYSEMPEIYRKADVFCFVPNPWESFGLVFLEALSCNLPVVTTDDPIRREIVGDAGIFIDEPENSKKLAEAISKALALNWGDKPRKQAEKFSWDKIASKYEELFTNLMK